MRRGVRRAIRGVAVRRLAAWSLAVGGLVIAGAVGCTKATSAPTPSLVERGELLVRVGGCNDCHTPQKFDEALGAPVQDFSRRLSGHPQGAPGPGGTLGPHDQAIIGPTFTSFKLPFGVVYTTNLTPHPTGLGEWTEQQFIETMRTGRHLGVGRAVLPPMPWPGLGTLAEEELRAIFAYLQSLPAVDNPVPAPTVDAETLNHLLKVNEALRQAH